MEKKSTLQFTAQPLISAFVKTINEDSITIQHGSWQKNISRCTAEKFDFFQSIFEFYQLNNAYSKNYQSITIDLQYSYPGFNSNTAEQLFDLAENNNLAENTISSLSSHDAHNMIVFADYMGLTDTSLMHRIRKAHRKKNASLTLEDRYCENEWAETSFFFYALESELAYRLKKAKREEAFLKKNPKDGGNVTLNFSHLKTKSLQGLMAILSRIDQKDSIKEIDISNNKLERLRLNPDMFILLPCLVKITADNNKIEELNAQDLNNLPSNVTLSLSNNPLKKISARKNILQRYFGRVHEPNNITIDVSKTSLDKNEIAYLQDFLSLPYLKRASNFFINNITLTPFVTAVAGTNLLLHKYCPQPLSHQISWVALSVSSGIIFHDICGGPLYCQKFSNRYASKLYKKNTVLFIKDSKKS